MYKYNCDDYEEHEFDSGIEELHRVQVVDDHFDDLDSYRVYNSPSGGSSFGFGINGDISPLQTFQNNKFEKNRQFSF